MFIFTGKSKTHKSQGSSEDYSLDLTGPPSDPYVRLRHQPLVILGVLKLHHKVCTLDGDIGPFLSLFLSHIEMNSLFYYEQSS